ncbi:hypothetical protein JCM8547_001562 [Rhodosporidiobolus lusitaniae]
MDVEPLTSSSQQRGIEQSPLVTVTHKCNVSVIHALHSPTLSSEANVARFTEEGTRLHGHELGFELVFRGPVRRESGQIMGGDLFEEILGMAIVEVMNRKNLDLDIPFFSSRPSTIENICLFAWRNASVILAPHIFDLVEISVETDACPRGRGKGVGRTRVSFNGNMIGVPA